MLANNASVVILVLAGMSYCFYDIGGHYEAL